MGTGFFKASLSIVSSCIFSNLSLSMNFFGTVCENVYASVTSPKVVANIGYIRSKSSFSQIIQSLNLPLIAFKSSSTNPETKRTSSNDFWTELELVSA